MRRFTVQARTISLALQVIAFAGCAGYVPPSLPESESAKLVNDSHYLWLSKIDGNPVGHGRFRGTTTVTPGSHDVDLTYYRVTSTLLTMKTLRAEGQLHFKAAAGAAYTTKCAVAGYNVLFWIEEIGTGQVVAGMRPPQADGANAAISPITE